MTTFRFVWFPVEKQMKLALGEPMTTLRLAHKVGGQGENCLSGIKGVEKVSKTLAPALLVSFYYLKPFLEQKDSYVYRDWMMDSGAFSAYKSGAEIDLNEYIDTCLELMETDKKLVEIIALDVIGDPEGSQKNTEIMWEAGVPAIPVFHIDEPWDLLIEYCKKYPKVGLSCRFGEPKKSSFAFYDNCFARCWPHKFHSFGWASEEVLMKYPFHSADASTWELQPCAFGKWKTIGDVSIRGSKQDLRGEVEWYMKMERRVQTRWRKEMVRLDELNPTGPDLRLATISSERSRVFKKKATKRRKVNE